jgi:hypothetical protein
VNIDKIILNKIKNQKLANFYIVSPSSRGISYFDFFQEFEKKFIQVISSLTNENITLVQKKLRQSSYIDILQITKNIKFNISQKATSITFDTAEKNFTLDDFSDFYNFLNYKNNSLSHKFVLIYDASWITNIQYNKLLKSFEEPPNKVCIILLNSKNKKLISTIESRAIKLHLNVNNKEKSEYSHLQENIKHQKETYIKMFEDKEVQESLKNYFEKYNINDLLSLIKKDKMFERQIHQNIINLEKMYINCLEHKEKVLNSLMHYEKRKSVNTPLSITIPGLLDIFNA